MIMIMKKILIIICNFIDENNFENDEEYVITQDKYEDNHE